MLSFLSQGLFLLSQWLISTVITAIITITIVIVMTHHRHKLLSLSQARQVRAVQLRRQSGQREEDPLPRGPARVFRCLLGLASPCLPGLLCFSPWLSSCHTLWFSACEVL